MREDLARIVRDLGDNLRAEKDLPSGAHLLTPRGEVRRPKASETLDRIATAVRACARCRLSRTRQNAVPGEGNPESPLVIVGEAPGAEEDRQGRPFVGKAGDLLTKMLKAINVEREAIFIGNVMKCRPPENRDPAADEVAQCRRYLMMQIAAIRPKVILSLGRVSTQLLLETSQGILSLRGVQRPFKYHDGEAIILPSLHPAYLLRNASAKRDAWEDLKTVHRLLREATRDFPEPLDQ
jgi:uracil-DNA glycosylase family 4